MKKPRNAQFQKIVTLLRINKGKSPGRSILLIEAIIPGRVKLPEGEFQLVPGKPVDWPEARVRKLLERATGKVRLVEPPPAVVVETATDQQGSIVAVRIESPIIGQFWFVLSDTELFDSDDHLPTYHPAEIRALRGKGYGPEVLQAIHRAKVALEGTIQGAS